MGATGALSALQLGSSFSQSLSIKAQGDYESSVLNLNARFSELQAEDALRRGKRDATQFKREAKKLMGSQRVSLAAQGIDIESGSALDVQLDTAEQVEEDIISIKNNAWKEAWGYRVQAMDYRNQGQLAKLSAQNSARNTILSGGIQAYSTINSGGINNFKSLFPKKTNTFSTTPNFGSQYGGYA